MNLSLDDFSEQTLELEDDYEGRVIATLVRSPENTGERKSVLYLHGYNDYFFHTHVAGTFHEQGYNFYALDLRKYGRSLLPHQHPNYCRSLDEYFEELNQAIRIITEENPGKEFVLLGHSTGGLLASYYLNTGPLKEKVDKLVLNSPFLEFNATPFQRAVVKYFSKAVSFFFPYASKNKPLSHLYGASLLKSAQGEWDFNLDWKPRRGFPAYLKWVSAVFDAQEYLRRSSDIQIPILILHSSQSSRHRKWDEEISRSDMVLNVEHMKSLGRNLGDDITFLEIENAIHDIFLSSEPVRQKALNGMMNWLDKRSR